MITFSCQIDLFSLLVQPSFKLKAFSFIEQREYVSLKNSLCLVYVSLPAGEFYHSLGVTLSYLGLAAC